MTRMEILYRVWKDEGESEGRLAYAQCGSLPITYHFGAGPAKAHLKLAYDWKQTPAYDVVAMIRGEICVAEH